MHTSLGVNWPLENGRSFYTRGTGPARNATARGKKPNSSIFIFLRVRLSLRVCPLSLCVPVCVYVYIQCLVTGVRARFLLTVPGPVIDVFWRVSRSLFAARALRRLVFVRTSRKGLGARFSPRYRRSFDKPSARSPDDANCFRSRRAHNSRNGVNSVSARHSQLAARLKSFQLADLSKSLVN